MATTTRSASMVDPLASRTPVAAPSTTAVTSSTSAPVRTSTAALGVEVPQHRGELGAENVGQRLLQVGDEDHLGVVAAGRRRDLGPEEAAADDNQPRAVAPAARAARRSPPACAARGRRRGPSVPGRWIAAAPVATTRFSYPTSPPPSSPTDPGVGIEGRCPLPQPQVELELVDPLPGHEGSRDPRATRPASTRLDRGGRS